LRDFAVRGKEPVAEELQIYTWTDATLREIADLIKDVSPEARERNARLQFKLIYPDKAGRNVMTDIGMIHSQRRGRDDLKTLQAAKFQIGDFIDLAIILPRKGGPFNNHRGRDKLDSDMLPSHNQSGETVVEGPETESATAESSRSPIQASNEAPHHEDDFDDTDALKLEVHQNADTRKAGDSGNDDDDEKREEGPPEEEQDEKREEDGGPPTKEEA